jgi:hypothetical protein
LTGGLDQRAAELCVLFPFVARHPTQLPAPISVNYTWAWADVLDEILAAVEICACKLLSAAAPEHVLQFTAVRVGMPPPALISALAK